MSVVRTVLGDIPPEDFGRVDYHEHLFQRSPLLPGEDLDDEALSLVEASRLFAAGIDAMVEATPTGVGSNPAAVARISAASGLRIVHATGLHHGGHYAADDLLREASERDLVARFVDDVLHGFRAEDGAPIFGPAGDPVRAGLVKAGARYWSVGAFERAALAAAGQTSAATGCAVMVHLDYGSAAHEVLDALDASGAPPARVVLAHVDRNLDAGLHADLAARGAYLGYDGPARHREAPDSAILDCIQEVIGRGAGERLLIGGDVARRSRYISYGGMPGLEYLPIRFLPRLKEAVGAEAYDHILRRNPARLLAIGDAR